jgi:subtilisin family serine protease
MNVRLVVLALALAAGRPPSETAPPAADGILVRFKPGVAEDRRSAVLAGAEVMKVARRRNLYAVRSSNDGALLRRLAADPAVAAVQPNHVYRISETIPDDPRFSELWGLRNTGQSGGTPGADIAAAQAWDLTTGSSDVVVAVLDTGVRFSHQDLAANRWINPGETPGDGLDNDENGYADDVNGWDFVDNENDPFDGDGHGTHMAGTIGARGNNGKGVTGVCWDVRILALRFIGSNGGNDLDAIQALDYATDLKLNRGINIVAINCSWTSNAYSQALYDALKDAQDAGILIVCAAGNGGWKSDDAPVYPAAYDLPGVISVGASDRNDRMADLSCFGESSVDLFAPGVEIRSTYVPLDNVYSTRTGTSMAAAHVSGAIGLLAALRPGETSARRRARLLFNVDHRESLSRRAATCGRLNVFRALQDDETVPPDPVTTLAASDPSYSAVTLSWTATGDDGAIGQAAAYDVRFSTAPLSEATFDAAPRAPCPPLPAPSDTPQSMRVAGLDSATTYHFAMKSIDSLGNVSALSNAASATTASATTATTFFADDFEEPGPLAADRWTAPSPWGKATILGSVRAADSPSGVYGPNLDLPLTSAVFNLAGKRDATLRFAHAHALEAGLDFGFVEFSRDGGSTWEWVTQASGTRPAFAGSGRIPLPSLDGVPAARLRFRLRTNPGGSQDGWALDDVVVLADSMGTNGHPAAQPQTLTVLRDTALPLVLAGTDPEGSPLSFSMGTPPSNGMLTGTLPNVVYTPAPGFLGADAFTFTVSDGTDSSAPATVALTVGAPPSPAAPGSGDDRSGDGCGLTGLEAVLFLILVGSLARFGKNAV